MTDHRPRITDKTHKILKDIEEELQYFEEQGNPDVEKYYGPSRTIKHDLIIREGLKALREKGLP